MFSTFTKFPFEADLNKYPQDLKERIIKIQQNTGFIPNVFLGLSYQFDQLRLFMDQNDLLMNRKLELSQVEKEMLIVSTSSKNQCKYCVVVHGAILRVISKDQLLAEKVAYNFQESPLSNKHKAMLQFAQIIAINSQNLNQNDYDQIKKHFSQIGIWEIGSLTAFYAMSNRLAHLMNLEPNEEFYIMGRVNKEIYNQIVNKK